MSIRVRLAVLLVTAMLLAGCGSAGGGNAAIVNGQAISLASFDRQVRLVRDSMVSQGLDPKSAEGKATLDQMRADILEQMIDAELMRQGAAKEGISVSDSDVNSRLEQVRKDAGGDEAFKKSLKEANLTEADFRTLILRDQIIYERLYDKLAAALPKTAEQVRVRHILLNTEKEASDARSRLAKGEDFAALAKALSLDSGSKDNGGDLGFFPRGVLDPGFEDAAFTLKINEVGVVATDYGYHVMQVLEREANRQIAPEVMQILGEEAINKYLDSLRSQAKVQRLVQLPATPTPSQ